MNNLHVEGLVQGDNLKDPPKEGRCLRGRDKPYKVGVKENPLITKSLPFVEIAAKILALTVLNKGGRLVDTALWYLSRVRSSFGFPAPPTPKPYTLNPKPLNPNPIAPKPKTLSPTLKPPKLQRPKHSIPLHPTIHPLPWFYPSVNPENLHRTPTP